MPGRRRGDAAPRNARRSRCRTSESPAWRLRARCSTAHAARRSSTSSPASRWHRANRCRCAAPPSRRLRIARAHTASAARNGCGRITTRPFARWLRISRSFRAVTRPRRYPEAAQDQLPSDPDYVLSLVAEAAPARRCRHSTGLWAPSAHASRRRRVQHAVATGSRCAAPSTKRSPRGPAGSPPTTCARQSRPHRTAARRLHPRRVRYRRRHGPRGSRRARSSAPRPRRRPAGAPTLADAIRREVSRAGNSSPHRHGAVKTPARRATAMPFSAALHADG